MIKAEDLINLSEKQEEIRELLYPLSTEGCIGIDRDGTIFTIIVSAEEELVIFFMKKIFCQRLKSKTMRSDIMAEIINSELRSEANSKSKQA